MNLKQLILGAFSCAIIFIVTAFIAVPVANLGYINLGDSIIMLSAIILNPPLALLTAGIASASADIYLGFPQYAIFTFVIKGFEAFVVAYWMSKYKDKFPWVYLVAGLIVVLGYACADMIITQSIPAGFLSAGMNSIQASAAVVIAVLLYKPFIALFKKM